MKKFILVFSLLAASELGEYIYSVGLDKITEGCD